MGELGQVKSQSAFYLPQVETKLGELGQVKSQSTFYLPQVLKLKKKQVGRVGASKKQWFRIDRLTDFKM